MGKFIKKKIDYKALVEEISKRLGRPVNYDQVYHSLNGFSKSGEVLKTAQEILKEEEDTHEQIKTF